MPERPARACIGAGHCCWPEPVASFRAFDGPLRNLLVLFKLHRRPDGQDLDLPLPGDKILIPVEERAKARGVAQIGLFLHR
jgi:hypothetical protein